MKDIIKLAITLMIICAVAAGALAVTNSVTSEIIRINEEKAKVSSMQRLFPTVDKLEDQTVDGQAGTVGFDAGGKMVGVLAEGRAEGYGGTIRFNLAVDGEGKIVELDIIEHSETPGLGAKITEAGYRKQYEGLTADSDFKVDTISGATISARAMENGVKKALQDISVRFLGAEGAAAPSFSLDAVADGTYTGTAAGFKSDITVEVTVASGKITDVKILDHNETPDRFAKAESVRDEIITKQSVQVDAASGATMSSDAIMQAVLNALTQ
ncbi:MAG: FMN-binding protein [Clostridiales bacterium]|jgi:RnfABCDGE-type electron transport complex G subunit|nr:FMN-binding protein [Clostridiales bacterium]